jgi:hypothetical protein
MIQTPTPADRLRIAAERDTTNRSGNQKGVFNSASNNGKGTPFDHEGHAASLRRYVIDSFVIGAPRIGFLLAGEDRAEMLDACHELACGHLPLDHCSCVKAGVKGSV